jgi:hypothetical protein
VAYEGTNTSLSYSQGQTPGAYFYRVKAVNAGGDSPWSEVQSITIYPLHVGLAFRWDGTGKISTDSLISVGTHETVRFDKMTDGDTIEMSGRFWYDPNPRGWEEETYTGYYSVSTGNYRFTGESGDSILKWGYDWKLPYWSGFTDGQTIQIDGQPFTVHGPIWGQTPVGNIAYWELKNQADFVLLDYGDGFVEIVHTGNATLRYETGPYGMLVYDDIRRSIYYQGEYIGWWVQYISQLTSRTTSPVAYQTVGLPLPQPAPRENQGLLDSLFFRPPLLPR